MSKLTTTKLRLSSPYLSKKIESGTLKKVLDSPYQTAYQIYLIANGIKELQEFADIKHERYLLTAYVKTECGFIGEARDQVWSIIHLQPLLKKSPKYTVRCELLDIVSNKVLYKSSLEHKNQDVIYNEIQECIDNLNKIII